MRRILILAIALVTLVWPAHGSAEYASLEAIGGRQQPTECEIAIWDALITLPNRPAAFDEHAGAIAFAMAGATQRARDAATLLSVGYFESGFQPRIQAGECRKLECDRGLARGFWQMHASPLVPEWGDLIGLEEDTILVGASAAARILKRGRRVCRSESGAISYFAVGTCFGWRGADERARFAEKIERKLGACNKLRSSESVAPPW